jgi:hypothetical protein
MMQLRAIRLLVAGGASFVVFVSAACSGDPKGFEGTVLCRATRADVMFDVGRVEVRSGDEEVGWADAGDRVLNDDVCEKVATQTGWFVGIRYTRERRGATLRCRLPGRFFLHAHPTYSSESGEVFPDGSALYVVVPARNTIVVSAGIGEDESRSNLSFSKRHCPRG